MKKILSIAIIIVVLFFMIYVTMPVFAYGFTQLAFVLLVAVILIMFFTTSFAVTKIGNQYRINKKPSKIFFYLISKFRIQHYSPTLAQPQKPFPATPPAAATIPNPPTFSPQKPTCQPRPPIALLQFYPPQSAANLGLIEFLQSS